MAKTPPPIKTPIYPGGSNQMNWPWAQWFDGLSAGAGGTGAPGPIGPQGPPGPGGPQGPAGSDGASGETGPEGLKGLKGDQGDIGTTGPAGLGNFIDDGFTGITDTPVLLWDRQDEALYVGVSGNENWIQIGNGAQGETGPAGPIGSEGPKGDQGATGWCELIHCDGGFANSVYLPIEHVDGGGAYG